MAWNRHLLAHVKYWISNRTMFCSSLLHICTTGKAVIKGSFCLFSSVLLLLSLLFPLPIFAVHTSFRTSSMFFFYCLTNGVWWAVLILLKVITLINAIQIHILIKLANKQPPKYAVDTILRYDMQETGCESTRLLLLFA